MVKEVGAGRVLPLQETIAIVAGDLQDTGSKMWDWVTGGDGVAGGEKLNATQEREVNPPVRINRPSPKD